MVGASAQPPQAFHAPRDAESPRAQGPKEFKAPKDFQAPKAFPGFPAGEFKAPKNFKAPKDFPSFPGPREFRGPRGPQGPHGFRPAPKDIVVVPLTDEEVAERFAKRLHLDGEKAEAFAPLLTAFRAELKGVEEQYPITFKPKGPRGPKAEKPTEDEIAEMKAQHKQFDERHKAEKAVKDAYKDRFFEVLNHRQYHWMFRLLRDKGMFVKFERVAGEEKEADTTNRAPESEGIANGIKGIDNNQAEGEWHSINGVALKGQPTQSGIYVKDGKKVLVR